MMPQGIMQSVDWRELDVGARAKLLARPAPETSTELADSVRNIVRELRDGGDAALREITRRLDGVDIENQWVPPQEIARADSKLPADLRTALSMAIGTVKRFHRVGRPDNRRIKTSPGVLCESRWSALNPVGLYVPAGSAPLPSTAIMLGVPAVQAGCSDIIIATPPNARGEADPAVLAVAHRLGIDQVLLAGGAQAVAALAYGTETVPKAVKIFGPGNRFVTEAKRQAAEDPAGAAMDLPAGPSEVMVIADACARPEWVAADLLSQAEHGPDSQVFLLTDDEKIASRVNAELSAQLASLPRAAIARKALAAGAIVRVTDLEQAISVANDYAPEHLILATDRARELLIGVYNAGSVFVGHYTPEALGDYISGTNHVLPTGGWARVYDGLAVHDFMRRMTVQEATPAGLAAIGPHGARMAAHEGLEGHRRAIELRLSCRVSAATGSEPTQVGAGRAPPTEGGRA